MNLFHHFSAQVRDLWEEFYSNADAVVFMVDSADNQRFDEAKTELRQLLDSEELKSVPILVFGNKSDLEVSESNVSWLPSLFWRRRFYLQGSESREKLIEKLELAKYMDTDAEEDDERIVEVTEVD